MKIPILCCLTVSLYLVNRVDSAPNGGISGLNLNIPSLQFPALGLSLPSAAPIVPTRNFGFPRKPLPFLPVPVVKKVTHHHIHHVIAHKGVVKPKFSEGKNGFELDNKEEKKKNTNQLNYKSYKDEVGLQGDFSDNGYRSAFHKRGGAQQINAQHLGDLIAQSTAAYNRGSDNRGSGIRGFIGGQKAEFVPLIIGIIDDGTDIMTGLTGGDTGKEYSSRMGLFRPESNLRRQPYIPSKDTLKLFEDLAKLGFK